MPSVNEGLEVAGQEPAANETPDPNTESGFNALLAQKVAPQPDEQSPAEVRREIAAPDLSRSVKAGLEFSDPTAPRKRGPSPTLPQHLAEGQKALESEQAQTTAALEELAERRFMDVMQDPYATETDRAAAALRLKQDAPGVYDRVRTDMDVAALDDLDPEFDEEPEDESLPGYRLDSAVQQLEAALKVAETRDQIEKLQAQIAQQHVDVLKDVYNTSDPDAVMQQAEIDFAVLRAHGVQPTHLSAEELRGYLEYVRAADEVGEEELRSIRLKESILAADSGSVADGYETVVDGRLVSLTPRPSLNPDPEKIRAKIDARVKERQASARGGKTVAQFKRELLEPERTNWRHGLTDTNGRPTTAEKATGEDARRKREEAERVARLRSFI